MHGSYPQLWSIKNSAFIPNNLYNKSSLFISHRLASTRFCDRILFIADEKIVEEGTHEELLALGGKYAQLFEIQSKYYKEGEIEDEK